jgi:homoserine kinase
MGLGAKLQARLMAGQASVTVRVPATSANLGPAFDSVGLALALYDEVEARFEPGAPAGAPALPWSGRDDVVVTAFGQGAGSVPTDGTNLVARTIREGLAAFDESGKLATRGLRVTCRNELPHGRGLGSSAAAIVAGLLAAAHLAGVAEEVSSEGLLAMAARIEGHPDNVAAAVHGGATISWWVRGPADVGMVGRAARFEVAAQVVPVLMVPEVSAGTASARAALPAMVPHADAAFNAARSALLVHALSNDPKLLFEATDDRLHQQQRRDVYPESLGLVEQLRKRGIPAAISGAGPSVIAFAIDGSGADTVARIRELVGPAPRVAALPISSVGAHAR